MLRCFYSLLTEPPCLKSTRPSHAAKKPLARTVPCPKRRNWRLSVRKEPLGRTGQTSGCVQSILHAVFGVGQHLVGWIAFVFRLPFSGGGNPSKNGKCHQKAVNPHRRGEVLHKLICDLLAPPRPLFPPPFLLPFFLFSNHLTPAWEPAPQRALSSIRGG